MSWLIGNVWKHHRYMDLTRWFVLWQGVHPRHCQSKMSVHSSFSTLHDFSSPGFLYPRLHLPLGTTSAVNSHRAKYVLVYFLFLTSTFPYSFLFLYFFFLFYRNYPLSLSLFLFLAISCLLSRVFYTIAMHLASK